MIEFNNVSKIYAGQAYPSVDNVSLLVQQGETLVLVGTSGSGKTTLLKMVNRLLEPSLGSIAVNGRSVKEHDVQDLRRSIGYVFQRFGLLPHFTVGKNISLPLKIAGAPARGCRQRVHELLEFMGLAPDIYENRLPHQLSGGEQQRIQVARALAHDPPILLMDEPFGALDVITRSELQAELLRLKQTINKTILLVTHDIMEAFLLGDRIAIMHQGRIHQVGTKHELMRHQQTDFVRTFLRAGFPGLDGEISHF